MNVSPDIYQHIASFSDDITVLRMLSTNRKFNDPILFQRMIRNRYPLLERYKLPYEDWKHFYLRMIQAIYSLAENDFPYVPDVRFNPVEIYQKLQKPRKDDYWGRGWGEGIDYSSAIGRLDLLKIIVESAKARKQEININTINSAVSNAVRIKNTPILEYLMEIFNYRNYDYIVETAASHNNSEIFDRYLDQVADYVRVMDAAASSGNAGFIYKLLDKNPNMKLREPLYTAAKRGNMEVVRILLNANNNYDLNYALQGAGKNGHIEILKLLIERGANKFNYALRYAASNGSLDTVQFIMENYHQHITQDDLNEAMVYAASSNKLDVLEYLISQGSNNFDRILLNAAYHGNIPITELMIQHGATNIRQALYKAQERIEDISSRPEILASSDYHRNELNNLIKFVDYFTTLN